MSTDRPLAGPSGPASPSPDDMPATRRRAARFFDTGLRFVSHGGGRWVATDTGERYEIERRRGEPGCPAGWWYFGPGARYGTWAGDYADEAAALAAHHARDSAGRGDRP